MKFTRDWRKRIILPLALMAPTTLIGPFSVTAEESSFYKHIEIDPSSLAVSFRDPVATDPEPRADFYWPFYGADGGCLLSHYDTTNYSEPRPRYNSLALDERHRLISKTKHQLLLHSEFGSFYSETHYRYADSIHPEGVKHIAFHVHAYSNSLESEPPQISNESGQASMTLSAVSVLRVFAVPDGHRLVAATYAADGTLLSIADNTCSSGDCQFGGSVTFAYAKPELFGFLKQFPIDDYLKGSRDVFTPTTIQSQLDCVNFHYNRNHYVRQDIMRPNQREQSHMLSYRVTSEDEALAPIDDMKLFASPQ